MYGAAYCTRWIFVYLFLHLRLRNCGYKPKIYEITSNISRYPVMFGLVNKTFEYIVGCDNSIFFLLDYELLFLKWHLWHSLSCFPQTFIHLAFFVGSGWSRLVVGSNAILRGKYFASWTPFLKKRDQNSFNVLLQGIRTVTCKDLEVETK